MFAIGSLILRKQLIICGHPGLHPKKYRFPIAPGLYTAYASDASGEVTRIVLVTGDPAQAHAHQPVAVNMSNANHGGILLAEAEAIDALPAYLDDVDEDLHNFFADGLTMRESLTSGGWKSNASDGNVIFAPSREYYVVKELKADVAGYEILCGADYDDAGK